MSNVLPGTEPLLALIGASSSADAASVESWFAACGMASARVEREADLGTRIDRDRPAIVALVEAPRGERTSTWLARLAPRERDLCVIVFTPRWSEERARAWLAAGAFACVDLARGSGEGPAAIRQARRAALERDQRRCAEALATLGLAAGGVVHDLNNALTAILGNVELMREMAESDLSPELAQPWVRCFDAIDEVSDRVARLAKQLVCLGRASPPRADTVAPQDALIRLRVALGGVRPGITSSDVRSNDGAPPFRADLDELVDVLSLLVLSARDALSARGKVRLEASEETIEETASSQALLPAGRYCALTVLLTGSRAEEGTLDRLFEPKSLRTASHHRNVLAFPAAFALVRRLGGHLLVHRSLDDIALRVYFPAFESSVEVLRDAA